MTILHLRQDLSEFLHFFNAKNLSEFLKDESI